MDTLLIKFIVTCFVCEFTRLTACIPLKYNYNLGLHTRLKRSPGNNFPLFGVRTSISAPDPIPNYHQTSNNFDISIKSKNDNINPWEFGNFGFDRTYTKETTTNLPPPTPLTTISSIPLDSSKNAESQITHLDNSKKFIENNNQKKKDDEVAAKDKKFIDSIFNNDQNVNYITSTTLDYTTETGIESTTTEELTRISSQVVASLLG